MQMFEAADFCVGAHAAALLKLNRCRLRRAIASGHQSHAWTSLTCACAHYTILQPGIRRLSWHMRPLPPWGWAAMSWWRTCQIRPMTTWALHFQTWRGTCDMLRVCSPEGTLTALCAPL